MRIVVLGAGYAGLSLARRLERTLPDDVEVVVVDETGEHLVQHELHRVVRRPSLADDISIPLSDALDRATVRRARVASVDPESRTVTLAGDEFADGGPAGETLSYDVAAVCLGAETNFYGLPGVEAHGTPLKRLAHAREIRREFLSVVETSGTVVVGGAGLSGVQVAGELAALADEEGASDAVDVVLLERESTVAPGFPARFRTAVRDALADAGVDVRTNARVERATDAAVVLAGGGTVGHDQFVWTGGIRGSSALAGERPAVNGTLRLDDRTFVLGDAARVVDANGEAVPASAQAALREARTVARSVRRIVDHERDGGVFEPRMAPFTFDSPGWLVSVGDDAVAQIGPAVVTGRAALALKTTVGAGYLTSVGAVADAAGLVNEEYGFDVGR